MASKNKRLLSFLALSAILIFIMISIPTTLGLAREGFDTAVILQQYFFYAVSGGLSLMGIWFLFFYESKESEDDEDYGSGLAYSSPGEKPSVSFFKRFGQFQLFFLSFIIFNTLGLFSYIFRQTSFTGISVLAQQFSPIDSLLFSSFLIPAAENLSLMFLLALGIFTLRYYARKHDWQSINFIGATYILILVGGIFGVLNHLLRYSSSDIQLITVFFFWTIGTAITLFTGSFLPFLAMHFANNFFFDLGRFLSSELLLIYIGASLIVLGVIYFMIYRDQLLGKSGGD